MFAQLIFSSSFLSNYSKMSSQITIKATLSILQFQFELYAMMNFLFQVLNLFSAVTYLL